MAFTNAIVIHTDNSSNYQHPGQHAVLHRWPHHHQFPNGAMPSIASLAAIEPENHAQSRGKPVRHSAHPDLGLWQPVDTLALCRG
jgi:hypothetical protein